MDLYLIHRHGFSSPQDLQEGAARSAAEGDKDGSGVRWIRSYVVPEDDGGVGTVCIYQADSPEAIRSHAAKSEIPAHEIEQVLDTVVVRPDPVAATA